MRRVVTLLLVVWLAWPLAGAAASPAAAADDDWAIANGHFYTQTAPAGRGYSVLDVAGIPFWTAFEAAGGVEAVGYPISNRFTWNGSTVQAFQKVIFQWPPAGGSVAYLNVFDLLHDRGLDGWLRSTYAVPEPAAVDDTGKPWPQIVRERQAWLDTLPALRERYFAVPNPLDRYGLPTSPVVDYGSVQVIRLQRAVIQRWAVATPWAAAGQVTVANGGDLAKEAGLLPAEALRPVAAVRPPSAARQRLDVDPLFASAVDALDSTRTGRPLVETLADASVTILARDLPGRVRAAYLPTLQAIVVNRALVRETPLALSTVIGHEAVHLRDDRAGLFDGSAWQCYQSELRAFTATAEIWREFYPNGKPDPQTSLETELNELLRWVDRGSSLDRLYTLGEKYHQQCGDFGSFLDPAARPD